jgi:hypothetical protein
MKVYIILHSVRGEESGVLFVFSKKEDAIGTPVMKKNHLIL